MDGVTEKKNIGEGCSQCKGDINQIFSVFQAVWNVGGFRKDVKLATAQTRR